jgi:hypothetical protein
MAFTQKRLAGALTSSATQLTTAGANIYTPTSGVTAIVKQLLLCNTTTTAKTVSIYILPTSQTTVADAFAIFKDVSLDDKETLILNTSIVLTNSAGDKLHMLASANTSVTATVFGIEEA